jgi:threonine-phosphate decarboxylase
MNFHGGCDRDGVIDFSVNIPPLAYPETLKNAVADAAESLRYYPQTNAEGARDILADVLGIEKDELLLGNGATELIYLAMRALKPNRAVILEPTFTEYRRALSLVGSDILDYSYRIEPELGRCTLDEVGLEQLIHVSGADLLMLCNPNNPTGNALLPDWILTCAEKFKDQGLRIVLDESFIDFLPERQSEAVLRQYIECGRILVIRSMTKTYEVPGIRLGYAAAGTELINRLLAYKEPWSVNVFAQAAVPVLMAQEAYLEALRQWCQTERAFFKSAFQSMPGVHAFESHANYVLIYANPKRFGRTQTIQAALLKHQVYLRPCLDFRGLGEGYFRIAYRTHDENKQLIQILWEVLQNDKYK